MSSDELREQLADRFLDIYSQIPGGTPESSDNSDGRLYARVLATECLRQMEWASRRVWIQGPLTIESSELKFGELVPVTKVVSPAKLMRDRMTIAPATWTPTEETS